MYLGHNFQWLFTSQKETQDSTYRLMEVHNAISQTHFIKIKLESDQTSGPNY